MSKRLIIIFLLSYIFFGCNSNASNKNVNSISDDGFSKKISSTANRDKLPMADGKGVSLGLYNENGSIEKNFNFRIRASDSFEKFISITNSDKPRNYKILLFVDYKQSNFKVDGKRHESFNFKMDSLETLEIPVKLDSLPVGLHDILFVVVKYPDIKSLDEEFRKITDMNHLLFLRYTVSVGDNSKFPDYKLTNGNILNKDNLDGSFINLEEKNLSRWLSQDVSAGSNLNYFLHVGNNSNIKKKSYAMLVLNDWKQVSISGDINTLFFELDSGKEFVFPAKLKVPKKKGIYDLTTIVVHNPYQLLDYNNKECETPVRVGLNVK